MAYRDRLVRVLNRLASSRAAGLYPYDRVFERAGPTHVLVDGCRHLMASSYDYLSLIGDKRIEQAAVAAIQARGTGTGGVRLLTGTVPEHRDLERCLAEHYGTEDCATFSSGYFANLGAMAAFGGPDVTAYVDALSHRSVVDACRLAGSPIKRFSHNDPEDLERRLASQERSGRPAVVFVESLYSMDGDFAPMAAFAQLAARFGIPLLVDDAHGLGVLEPPCPGSKGRHVSAWVGSLSKAIPSNGGFVAADAATIDRIRHLAGPYIFSAAAAPGAVAAASEALRIVAAEPGRRQCLRKSIGYFASVSTRDWSAHDADSPIFPIRYADDAQTLRAAAALGRAGIVATPIVAPAVGSNQPRLRICINAAHQPEDLGALASAIGAFDDAEGIARGN